MIRVSQDDCYQRRVCRVAIRRDLAEVKPEAEQLDGKTFEFTAGWPLTEVETSIYIGEWAMLLQDPQFFKDHPGAPCWIASGDLVSV